MNNPIITQEQMMEVLDKCYNAATNGIPGSPTCQELASEYLEKYKTPELAAQKLITTQIAKATTSGFLTSLGGLITLPVALPANIASVLYVQMRMIASIAILGGYDPHDDEVQTLVYVCLAGISIGDMCKQAGIAFGNKLTMSLIKKIPGAVLTKINQKVGFRFVTKFGTKGIVNLGKAVPFVGGIVGGGLDFAGTKVIAIKSYNTFILDIIE